MLVRRPARCSVAHHRAMAGDTLIEVMLAITLFSIIVVSALTIMNQGSSTAQRSLEITLVRQAIDGQADALRFMQASYVQEYKAGIKFQPSDTSPAAEYSRIISHVSSTTEATAFGQVPCDATSTGSFILNTKKFIVDPKKAAAITATSSFAVPVTFAQLKYSGTTFQRSEGMWIEGVRTAPTGTTGYIDFHIRACWNAPGVSQPMNLGTIVRLYEPRG